MCLLSSSLTFSVIFFLQTAVFLTTETIFSLLKAIQRHFWIFLYYLIPMGMLVAFMTLLRLDLVCSRFLFCRYFIESSAMKFTVVLQASFTASHV